MTEFVLTEAVYLECTYGDFIEPTIRKEDLVRCRDCRYHVSVTDGDVCRKPCGDEAAGRVWVEPEGFCAWGKQRSK